MSDQVRIGIIGVGNCARGLLDGIAHYRATSTTAGLTHPEIGPYRAGDVEPVAAWDVDISKIGRTLWQARTQGANLEVGIDTTNAYPVGDEVTVEAAPRLDGIGSRYAERITTADADADAERARAAILRTIVDTDLDVLVNYLPVGSQAATEWWAEIALAAGVGFVNCIPVFIARSQTWRHRFREAGLPLLGDDIKSQLGATYLHRALVAAFADRGITLDRTYQLNVGGNMDFYNMLQQDRLAIKRESKTIAVTSAYDGDLEPENVHIGPSDHVPWLGDTKKAFIRCEGRGFGGAPIELEMQLTVPDSPNSAGIVIDAARIAKLAAEHGDDHVAEWASAWLFKAPPEYVVTSDTEARDKLETWLKSA